MSRRIYSKVVTVLFRCVDRKMLNALMRSSLCGSA